VQKMAVKRTVPALGTAKKFYESSAIFSKYISEENITKLKNMFFYRPNDTHDFHQIPPANMKMPGVERITGYRYPAPGSQKLANIPTLEDEDRKYDIKYFSRDTRRYGHLDEEGNSMRIEDVWGEKSKELSLLDTTADRGSPGTHYTAATVKEYDPTGLRSAMTATHAEAYKARRAHMPTHNVWYAWEKKAGALEKLCEENAEFPFLPPVPGMNVEEDAPVICGIEKHTTW